MNESYLEATPLLNDKRKRTEMDESPKLLFSKTELSQLLDEKLLPLKSELSALKESLGDDRIKQLEHENAELKSEVKLLCEQVTTNDLYLRKNNVCFYGIKESIGNPQVEDCEALILSILSEICPAFNERTFERVHRLGPPRKGYNRPIIARLAHYKDKLLLFTKRKILHQRSGIRINDDIPKEMEKRRKILYPILRLAQSKNYKAQLKGEKLFINGQLYTSDSLDKLPKTLRPEYVFTPTKNGITAFFTRASPLSNHFECTFTVSGEEYNCAEQYLMKHKALVFKDTQTADQIMLEKDPVKQKALGKKIRDFDATAWEKVSSDIMYTSLLAKFQQNPDLIKFLHSTGDTQLVEANRSDSYWGVGLGLWDERLWDVKNHTGKNILGKQLMTLRENLK